MKYFTLKELSRTSQKLDNILTEEAEKNLTTLVDKLLDIIREEWGNPIIVNSGYRSIAVNKAVGGVFTSDHTRGRATDITTGSKENNKKLFDLILELHKDNKIEFDQLIDEKDYQWIHISYREGANRNQVLHLK